MESPKSSLSRVQVRALTASGSLKLRLKGREKEVKLISKMCYAAKALRQPGSTKHPFEFPRRSRINSYAGAFSGEGSGNSLQYSCLENPVGGGAW